MTDRVKFADGPQGSTSWAYVTAEGTLVVECYDHGAEAASDPQGLPERLAARFGSYFEVRAWLDEHRIAYRHEFDSWA